MQFKKDQSLTDRLFHTTFAGDDRSGRISRWDVAALAIEAITSKDTINTTFECYNKATAQPLANVGLSNILKKQRKEGDTIELTGKERNGQTFAALLKGLEQNA